MIPSEDDSTMPAAISTVNLITNQLYLGDAHLTAVNEVVSASGTSIVLPSSDTPVANTFRLFKNGQLLVASSDYTQTGAAVTLTVTAQSEDVYLVDYLTIRA